MYFALLLFHCISTIFAAVTVEVNPREEIRLNGQSFTAVCQVKRQITNCRWKLNGDEIHSGIWTQGYEKGDCRITIQFVQEKHNGVLKCQLFYKKYEDVEYAEGNITLVVAKAPNAPHINVIGLDPPNLEYPPSTFEKGETIQAECKIEYGRPAANISWFIGTEPIYSNLSESVIEDLGDGQKTVRQTLTRVLKYSDNGKNLRCVAHHIALELEPLYNHLYILNVYFSPKFKDMQINFTIGRPGKITVRFFANPSPNITWWVDENRIQEGDSDDSGTFHAANLTDQGRDAWEAVLHIDKITSEDVKKNYTLQAGNKVGKEMILLFSPANFSHFTTEPNPPAKIKIGRIGAISISALFTIVVGCTLIFWGIMRRKRFVEVMNVTEVSEK